LTVAAGHKAGFRKMIGHQDLTDVNGVANDASLQAYNSETKSETTLYVPLQFWFCRNVGLSLPLIALQYHEVKITVEFRRASECYVSSASVDAPSLGNTSLWVDYFYLDTDERRRFAQVSHEYLIEQVQFTGAESLNSSSDSVDEKVKLNFNHPVKELVWVVQHDDLAESDANQWSNYTTVQADNDEESRAPSGSNNPVASAKLQLNGHDRFATREGDYFNLVQTYQHHTNCPVSPGINVYSFALKPESHQPSGSCNFSRIDNAALHMNVVFADGLSAVAAKVRVYAVSYNVFRVMSGMGGLAYSN
jgi:hypothetical protein